jgi:hypothetical protein
VPVIWCPDVPPSHCSVVFILVPWNPSPPLPHIQEAFAHSTHVYKPSERPGNPVDAVRRSPAPVALTEFTPSTVSVNGNWPTS